MEGNFVYVLVWCFFCSSSWVLVSSLTSGFLLLSPPNKTAFFGVGFPVRSSRLIRKKLFEFVGLSKCSCCIACLLGQGKMKKLFGFVCILVRARFHYGSLENQLFAPPLLKNKTRAHTHTMAFLESVHFGIHIACETKRNTTPRVAALCSGARPIQPDFGFDLGVSPFRA